MDALVLINAHGPAVPREPLELLLGKARTADGVIAYFTAPADEPGFSTGAADGIGPREDDLVLTSHTADVFESFDDLALGLQDLGIERLIVAGADEGTDAEGRGAVWATAMAGLAHAFSVVFVDSAVTIPGASDPVAWMPDALAAGAQCQQASDIWLKM